MTFNIYRNLEARRLISERRRFNVEQINELLFNQGGYDKGVSFIPSAAWGNEYDALSWSTLDITQENNNQ